MTESLATRIMRLSNEHRAWKCIKQWSSGDPNTRDIMEFAEKRLSMTRTEALAAVRYHMMDINTAKKTRALEMAAYSSEITDALDTLTKYAFSRETAVEIDWSTVPVSKLDIGVRERNILKTAELETVKEILNFGTERLTDLRTCGVKSRKRIEDALKKIGAVK